MQTTTSLWQRLIAKAGLDYLALGLFLLVFSVLLITYGAHFRFFDGSVIWPSLVLLVIATTRFFTHLRRTQTPTPLLYHQAAREALLVVRDWLPLILLVLIYENLRGLTGLIRPDVIDEHLYKADVLLFGAEPTIWIQKFTNKWLTDYFSFAYMLYFILPLILATTLYLRKHREDFKELMTGVLLVQYFGFLLYIIFPAGPPRFTLAHLYEPAKLTGALGLYELTHGAYDSLNSVPAHSSFPSLHCALSLTALLFAWRFRKSFGSSILFWIFLPLVVSLWISTVYLRHHWIVDCFAGFILSIILFTPMPWLRKRYTKFRRRVLIN
ncbi:MAG: inositol phosphorylceramide synthase [Deltaproteobacteria bacterium]|nr:inositol phosphorylceramide synthase [Deltaproteobacteria bacterium]